MHRLDLSNELRTMVLTAALSLLPIVSYGQYGSASQTVLRLSLKGAVEIALAPNGNYQLQLAQESVQMAQANFGESRAALVPNFAGSITEQNQTVNLDTLGLAFKLPISGFTFPRSVGPFSTFDSRIRVTDNLLNLGILRRVQASRERIQMAKGEVESAKDEIASFVAKAYWAAARAELLVKVAEANVRLGEELLEIANHRESAGKSMLLDVTRARSQLSDEQEHEVEAKTQCVRTRLELLKLMHVSLDTAVELTDETVPPENHDVSLGDEISMGLTSRADLSVQRKRARGARLSDGAVRSESYPSVVAFADYGALGLRIDQLVATHTVGISFRIPIFDGGRQQAARAASLTEIREEEIRARDLRDQVELEVRESFESLRSAKEQVKDAEEAVSFAQDGLAQARRRYEAGAAGNLELVEAQRRIARGEEKRVDAVFNYRRALIDLWLATGTIRTRVQ